MATFARSAAVPAKTENRTAKPTATMTGKSHRSGRNAKRAPSTRSRRPNARIAHIGKPPAWNISSMRKSAFPARIRACQVTTHGGLRRDTLARKTGHSEKIERQRHAAVARALDSGVDSRPLVERLREGDERAFDQA